MTRDLWEAVALAPTPTAPLHQHHKLVMPGLEVKVYAAWGAWFLLRQLQWILGPMRRRSGHWFVQYGAMAAYYLPAPLAFYAASAVYSSPNADINLDMLCFGLLIASAQGALVMSAYTLSDAPLQHWHLLPWLLYFAWQQWDFAWGSRLPKLGDLFSFILLCIVPLLVVLLAKPPVATLDYSTKEIADYMVQESRSASPFFQGEAESVLEKCKYPFMQQSNGQWVNIKDVLQQCDRLKEQCTVDRDICLSYSFFLLLARRYFGFHCAEEGNVMVRDFLLTELLPDHRRTFTIVQVQLAFLHDYFFTIYQTKTISGGLLSVEEGIVLGLIISIIYALSYFFGYYVISHNHNLVFGAFSLLGALTVYLFINLPQIHPVLPTYWHPIKHVFKYYRTAIKSRSRISSQSSSTRTSRLPKSYTWRIKFWQHSLSSILFRQPCFWRNKIGQYSLMADFDRRSSNKLALVGWFKEHMLSRVSPGFIKHNAIKEDDVSLPDSVRSLVALTLRDINGPPTNGTRSLWRNRNFVPNNDLSWTCRQETHIHTILIWHIATCYLDMFPLVDTSSISDNEVATTLSKYCAYLVAFLPEFLPEHSLVTQILLQQVLKEAKDLLGRRTRKSMEQKRIMIQGLELPDDEAGLTAFQKGVRLGRQLEKLDTWVRWKVTAEFWAETVLYVAPSDKAAEHVEQLAKGGEFVTHLWALLSSAGILKRAAKDRSPVWHGPVMSDLDVVREARLHR